MSGSGFLRETQDALADDVALDLGGAAPDGLGPAEEERGLQDADRVVGVAPARRRSRAPTPRRPGCPVRIWPSMPRTSMASSMTSRWYSDQNILLVAPRAATPRSFLPCSTADRVRRPLMRMICTFDQAWARPWRIVRVVDPAVGPGHVGDDLELLLEAAVAGGGRRAPLEAERGHRHLPAVVDAADDVVLRAAGVGEEDLVELGRAVDLLDRPDLDAGLLHGARAGRRCPCASARRGRCGRAGRCSRRSRPGWSRPSGR